MTIPVLAEVNEAFNPPLELDILGKKFTVKILNPNEEDPDDDGHMDLAKQEIGIRLQPAKEYNQDTGLHEVIHAVDEILSIGLKEKQVHQLAAGLIAVLKHNPEFIAWLMK
jgi:hypothetical protein